MTVERLFEKIKSELERCDVYPEPADSRLVDDGVYVILNNDLWIIPACLYELNMNTYERYTNVGNTSEFIYNIVNKINHAAESFSEDDLMYIAVPYQQDTVYLFKNAHP